MGMARVKGRGEREEGAMFRLLPGISDIVALHKNPKTGGLRARGTWGGLATTGEGIAFAGALIVCEVFHGTAQQPVGLGLVSGAIGFEPGNDVGVQTHGDGPLCRPMEFSDFGCAPIEDRGSIGEIDVAISFLRRWRERPASALL